MQEKNTIRVYNTTVYLNFSERGDNFTLKVLHHSKWLAIIKFLKNRGWQIGENPSFKEHYSCLSKYHKKGFKNDVACLLEILPSSIKVQFGNVKNLWTGVAQSFWDSPSDDRMQKLTYMEDMRVKLEIYKLLNFCKKYNHERVIEDKEMQPEEYIIDKLNRNTHIHGKVTCLNDIKADITPDTYNWKCNSNDRNKKKIICGETKYFYSYRTKRLSCGVVWHNINNMWWVICNGVLLNICASDLFDYTPELPRRKPLGTYEANRLLQGFEKKRQYDKCIALQKQYPELLQLQAA